MKKVCVGELLDPKPLFVNRKQEARTLRKLLRCKYWPLVMLEEGRERIKSPEGAAEGLRIIPRQQNPDLIKKLATCT